MNRIDDHDLDAVRFRINDGALSIMNALRGTVAGNAGMVVNTLLVLQWTGVVNVAQCVDERTACGWNDCGFRYPVAGVLYAGEEPFVGVEVSDPVDTFYVGTHAFERLVARFLRALAEAARTSPVPLAQAQPWSEIAALAQRIDERVQREQAAHG
jgi:hypothetical protein